jgi:hypothetical protein
VKEDGPSQGLHVALNAIIMISLHLVYWKMVAVLSHDVAAIRSRLVANLTLDTLSRGTAAW